MIFFLISFFLGVVFYFINNYFKNLNFILNYKGKKHQIFSGLKTVPLTGGIFLSFLSVFLFYKYDPLFSLLIILIFLSGFISDINFLSSPKLRLLIQTVLIIISVYLLEISIYPTKFIFLDYLLENIYFKYFFSVFCLLIVINGSNFIDGLNGLILGYFSLIIFAILYLDYNEFLEMDKTLLISFIFVLIYLFVLNINNKLFMGDSGSYVLGFIIGYFLIKIYEANQAISPYFIVLLLWYPCFENLFSILRKFSLNRSPINPDNNHFHQLVFYFVKKRTISKRINPNNISSYLIIFYNILIFSVSLKDPSNTQMQIFLVIFNVFVYLIVYFRLFKYKYNI